MLGNPLPGVALPPNWERAYGYQDDRRFLAVWWSPNGKDIATAMMSAGVRSAIAPGWHFFFDLIKLLVRNGHTDERLRLYDGSHCLLLDLEQRTAYYTPLRDALDWLREGAAAEASVAETSSEDINVPDTPLPLAPSPLDIHYRGAWHKPFCIGCGGCGWRRTADWAADGYKLCEVCGQLDAYVRRFHGLQEKAKAQLSSDG